MSQLAKEPLNEEEKAISATLNEHLKLPEDQA